MKFLIIYYFSVFFCVNLWLNFDSINKHNGGIKMPSLLAKVNEELRNPPNITKIEVLDYIRFLKYKKDEITLSSEKWAEIEKIEAENDWSDADEFWQELAND